MYIEMNMVFQRIQCIYMNVTRFPATTYVGIMAKIQWIVR